MKTYLQALNLYGKAALAGAAVAVTAIGLGYADDTLTKGELWQAIGSGLTAAGAVLGLHPRN